MQARLQPSRVFSWAHLLFLFPRVFAQGMRLLTGQVLLFLDSGAFPAPSSSFLQFDSTCNGYYDKTNVTAMIRKFAPAMLIVSLALLSLGAANSASASRNDFLHKEEPTVRAQLAESLPLIGVDRVHRELGITGAGVGVLIIDDVEAGWLQCTPPHGQSVTEIVSAVAPDAEIFYYDLRTRADCTLSDEDIIAGLSSALDYAQQLNIRIINMSYGSGSFTDPCSSLFSDQAALLQQLAAQGILLIAAAGNDGYPNALMFPACLDEVLSVGATYDTSGTEYTAYETDGRIKCSEITVVDNLTCYSNRAYFLGLVAPGTTVSTPSNFQFGGTSAAAPIVAGVAALMFSASSDLTLAQVRHILQDTADPASDPINGWHLSRVNAYKAVRSILLNTPSSPVPFPAPDLAGFDINRNGLIDDPEFFAVIDQWIAGQINDDLFFSIIDVWISQARVSGITIRKEDPQELRIYDLAGKLISYQACKPGGQELRAQAILSRLEVPRGIYLLVMRHCETGRSTIKKASKLP